MYVYLITDGQRYKVGITNDLDKRLKQLQTGNSRALSIVAVHPCTDRKEAIGIERHIHKCLHQHRKQGEWFELDDRLKQVVVDSLCVCA